MQAGAAPVERVVALGESTTWGCSVSDKARCWVSQVARMLEESQGSPIELINQGIGINLLTRECPAHPFSSGPCALDRVDGDVIELKPDLLLLSYGLNDARGEVYNLVIEQPAKRYAAEVGVDWIIDEDHCHPNDLGHRLIANRVFEAIARNCSFVACRMPRETLIRAFSQKYGNGRIAPRPDGPGMPAT